MTGVGALGAIVGLLAAWQTVDWSNIKPMTHAAHVADVDSKLAKFVAAQDTAAKAVEDFRMEWKCDEWREELDELLGVESPSPRQSQRIIDLRERIDENDCHEYED